jgi:hypothetical protein
MAAQLIYTHDPDSTRDILQALPDWFGDPEALENYVRATADETFSSLLNCISSPSIPNPAGVGSAGN